jgi:DNA-binding NarL/FixJ family response regulator
VSEAADAEELLQLAAEGSGLALVLVSVVAGEGIDLHQVQELRRELPDVPLMVMAETDHPHHSRQILATGARGFVPTSLSLKVVLGAVDLVLAGGVYVPSSLIDNGTARPAIAPSREPWSELTRRQRDVLALIAQGKSNKLIADALTMSESTVKAHVKQIIKRLAVANRTQAALVATGHGGFTARAAAQPPAADVPRLS